jgi:beta-galactosidase
MSSYLLGAHVHRSPTYDLASVEADLATMQAMGLRHANIQTHWQWDEAQEGRFDFSDTDRLCATAASLGLTVSLTLTLEQVPAWAWRAHPGARMLNAYGDICDPGQQHTLPCDGKPGPCWDHPGMRSAASRYITALVRHCAPLPHLTGWNIWQEIGLWPDRPGDGLQQGHKPYNPETIAQFRLWLHRRYAGDLQALCAHWGLRLGSWDEIDPPRTYLMVPSWPDWSRFLWEDYLGRAAAWKAATVRAADPGLRPVAMHTSSTYAASGNAAEWSWQPQVDCYGTSYYPTVMHGGWPEGEAHEAHWPWLEVWAGLWSLTASWSTTRSAGTRWMLHEMAAGPYNGELHPRALVTAEDLRRWFDQQLAAGSTGTILWNTRPEHFWAEAGGQGFLDGQGRPTPRCAAITAFAAAVGRHEALLADSRPVPSPVGIGVSDASFRLMQAGGHDWLGNLHLRGAFHAALRAGQRADLLDIEREDLTQRKVLLLPWSPALAGSDIARLADFVAAGGWLVVAASAARFDGRGFAHPNGMEPALAALLGIAPDTLRLVGEPAGRRVWTPGLNRPGDILGERTLEGHGLLAGLDLRASQYLHTLEPAGAEILLRDGAAVLGTSHRHGHGQAIFLGTCWGLAAGTDRDAATWTAIARICTAAGAAGDRQGEVVRWVRRSGAGDELWTLVNPGPGPATWTTDQPLTRLWDGTRIAAGTVVGIPGQDLLTLVAGRTAEDPRHRSAPC